MDSRLKVAVVVPHIGLGGGARKSATVIAEALSERFDTVILTLREKRAKRVWRTFGGRVESLAVPWRIKGRGLRAAWARATRHLRMARALAAYCREQQIDVVVGVLTNTGIALSRVLYRNPAAVILSVRNNPQGYEFKRAAVLLPFYRAAVTALYRRADAVVAITRQLQQVLEQRYKVSNAVTIYNMYASVLPKQIPASQNRGTPLDNAVTADDPATSIPGVEPDEQVFITVGRMSRQKGHMHLVRAFGLVADQMPKVKLVIVGDGLLRREVEHIREASGLTDRVILLGTRHDVGQLLSKADLFVFSSLWEGFGLSLLEGLECGLPVISADCPAGPREILAPELALEDELTYPYFGSYGVLTPHIGTYRRPDELADLPVLEGERGLADAMLRFAREPAAFKRYAEAHRRVEDFRYQSIGPQWCRLVQNVHDHRIRRGDDGALQRERRA